MTAGVSQAVEDIYQARDALRAAEAFQRDAQAVTEEDLSAFAAALQQTLLELQTVAALLAEQASHIDRRAVQQRARRDAPADKLDEAVEHLIHLGQVLDHAAVEVGHSWQSSESARHDLGAGADTAMPEPRPERDNGGNAQVSQHRT